MLGLGILRINVPTTIQGSGKRTPKDGIGVMAEVQARLVRNGAMGTNGAAVGAVIRGGALAPVGSQSGMVGDAAVLELVTYAYASGWIGLATKIAKGDSKASAFGDSGLCQTFSERSSTFSERSAHCSE